MINTIKDKYVKLRGDLKTLAEKTEEVLSSANNRKIFSKNANEADVITAYEKLVNNVGKLFEDIRKKQESLNNDIEFVQIKKIVAIDANANNYYVKNLTNTQIIIPLEYGNRSMTCCVKPNQVVCMGDFTYCQIEQVLLLEADNKVEIVTKGYTKAVFDVNPTFEEKVDKYVDDRTAEIYKMPTNPKPIQKVSDYMKQLVERIDRQKQNANSNSEKVNQQKRIPDPNPEKITVTIVDNPTKKETPEEPPIPKFTIDMEMLKRKMEEAGIEFKQTNIDHIREELKKAGGTIVEKKKSNRKRK